MNAAETAGNSNLKDGDAKGVSIHRIVPLPLRTVSEPWQRQLTLPIVNAMLDTLFFLQS